MRTNFLTRQIDLLPIELLNEPITVIGAGAIGSFTVLQLAKLGFSDITVYDDDVVSEENMNSQFYRVKDIGQPKVLALQEIVKEFTETEVRVVNARFDNGTFPGIVIVSVDNMGTRKLIHDLHALKSVRTRFVIDPRMGAETAIMHVYNPMIKKDCLQYATTLYDDAQAVQENCTAKATIYTVNLLSGMIAKTVKDLVKGEAYLRNVSWDMKTFAMSSWNSENMNPNLIAMEKEASSSSLPQRIYDLYRECQYNGGFQIPANLLHMLSQIFEMSRQNSSPQLQGVGGWTVSGDSHYLALQGITGNYVQAIDVANIDNQALQPGVHTISYHQDCRFLRNTPSDDPTPF